DGSKNPGVFFVGAGRNLWYRPSDGRDIVSILYPGGTIRAVAMNRRDATHVFVIDSDNQVFGSFDAAVSWVPLTANLGTLTRSVRTLEVVNASDTPDDIIVIVGGEAG